MHLKKAKFIVFFTTFIDLIGFSILFPLFPSLLDFYLVQAPTTQGGLASRLLEWMYTLAKHAPSGLDHNFCIVVLFGGIVGSLYSLLQFITAPIWGQLSDNKGRRTILLFTLAGTCISYLIWLLAGSFELFLLARILGGIMAGNLSVATAAMADLTAKENRAKGMALIGIAFSLGFIIGPVIGGLSSNLPMLQTAALGSRHAWYLPALIAFTLSLINFFGALIYFPETLPIEKRAHTLTLGSHFLHLFRIDVPAIKRTCITYFIFLFAFSGMEFTLTFLCVERFQFTVTQNGFLFLYIGFMLTVVQGGLVRHLIPKLGEQTVAITGLLSGCLAFTLLAYAPNKTILYLALFFFSICGGYCIPALSSLVSLNATVSSQGKYLGKFRSAGALGRTLGPLAAASVYFYFGSAVSYIGGVLVTALAYFYCKSIKRLI